jgi:hypothetical protein
MVDRDPASVDSLPGRSSDRISDRTIWSHLGMTDATTVAVDQRPNSTQFPQHGAL